MEFVSQKLRFNTYSNGSTPYISDDGYWYINGVSTGTKAQGTPGVNGSDGLSFGGVTEYYYATSASYIYSKNEAENLGKPELEGKPKPPTWSLRSWKTSIEETGFGTKNTSGITFKYLWNVEGIKTVDVNGNAIMNYTEVDLFMIHEGGRAPKNFITYYATNYNNSVPSGQPQLKQWDYNEIEIPENSQWVISTDFKGSADQNTYLFEKVFVEYVEKDENGKNLFAIISGPTCISYNGKDGNNAITLSLDNDADVIAMNSQGQVISQLPITVTASAYEGGTQIQGAIVSLTGNPFGVAVNTENEYFQYANNTLRITAVPTSFKNSKGAFDFEYNGIKKSFQLSTIISNADYDLVIDKTSINSTHGGGVITIKVKKTEMGTSPVELTGPGSHGMNIYIDDNNLGENTWKIPYQKGQLTPIKVTLKDRNKFVWDEETIDFVVNGTNGTNGLGIQQVNEYYRATSNKVKPPIILHKTFSGESPSIEEGKSAEFTITETPEYSGGYYEGVDYTTVLLDVPVKILNLDEIKANKGHAEIIGFAHGQGEYYVYQWTVRITVDPAPEGYVPVSRSYEIILGADIPVKWETNIEDTGHSGTKPFLWNYEETTYTDGTISATEVSLLTRESRSIKEITEYYFVGTSVPSPITYSDVNHNLAPTIPNIWSKSAIDEVPAGNTLYNTEVIEFYATDDRGKNLYQINEIGTIGKSGKDGVNGDSSSPVVAYKGFDSYDDAIESGVPDMTNPYDNDWTTTIDSTWIFTVQCMGQKKTNGSTEEESYEWGKPQIISAQQKLVNNSYKVLTGAALESYLTYLELTAGGTKDAMNFSDDGDLYIKASYLQVNASNGAVLFKADKGSNEVQVGAFTAGELTTKKGTTSETVYKNALYTKSISGSTAYYTLMAGLDSTSSIGNSDAFAVRKSNKDGTGSWGSLFHVTHSGNMYVQGGGQIGSMYIRPSSQSGEATKVGFITSNTSKNSLASTADGLYLSSAGIALGGYFKVNNKGELTATKGIIAGWNITPTSLYKNFSSATLGMYTGNFTQMQSAINEAGSSNLLFQIGPAPTYEGKSKTLEFTFKDGNCSDVTLTGRVYFGESAYNIFIDGWFELFRDDEYLYTEGTRIEDEFGYWGSMSLTNFEYSFNKQQRCFDFTYTITLNGTSALVESILSQANRITIPVIYHTRSRQNGVYALEDGSFIVNGLNCNYGSLGACNITPHSLDYKYYSWDELHQQNSEYEARFSDFRPNRADQEEFSGEGSSGYNQPIGLILRIGSTFNNNNAFYVAGNGSTHIPHGSLGIVDSRGGWMLDQYGFYNNKVYEKTFYIRPTGIKYGTEEISWIDVFNVIKKYK